MKIKSKDDKVQDFLNDLESIDENMFDILMEVRDIVFKTHSGIEEKMMYGGILFSKDAEMFCGVFAYKNHVSLEFSNGYLMQDEHQHLEGKGKFRRHLKVVKKEDIEDKELAFYVQQAI